MTATVVWHGTAKEWQELTQAVERVCVCTSNVLGRVIFMCPPHEMLLEDQRAVDGLLFARRLASRLIREEFAPEVPPLGSTAAPPSNREQRSLS